MSRMTIDYGIDLGTTNSSIALSTGTSTEVIKNSLDADITPSAVYINNRDNLWVGQNAKSKAADERSEDDVFLEFKRRMGTAQRYVFRSSARRMLPEELSAEVLKSLRGDVFLRKDEEIASAVITVPAAFELHQCEATKRAGTLAGFSQVALLQEPTAAALAYGYQKLDSKAYWLVFDFGGGTFDAALIRSEDGSMVVANHGGDNFLGGSDIDWAIVEQILIPRVEKEYGLKGFRRGAERFKYDVLRLKSAAETAKIDLSQKPSTVLEAVLCKVADKHVTFETHLTREDIARISEPIINKAVNIAVQVLTEKRLSPSAVEKMVFVGGPTIAPYFRDLVQARLGISADLQVDPMTVVARGAAIFASTQRLKVPAKVSRPDKLSVDLIYKPVGADTDPLLGGKINLPPAPNAGPYTIEIVNQNTKWRSGRYTIKDTGTFQMAVRAITGCQNNFALELRDKSGTQVVTEPDRFSYTVGMVIEEQPIINHMGVAMSDNRVSQHFTKGQGLPAKCTKTYRSSTGLKKGESSQLLRIPIVEGNREQADRNILIGKLEITANHISRDMPVGSEIEVTLAMDTSRLLTVVAYVPLLDEEFPAKITLGGEAGQPDLKLLRNEWQREAARLAELKQRVESSQDTASTNKLNRLLGSDLLSTLDLCLSGEGADFDALLKADRDLLEFKIRLDDIAAQLSWPLLVIEVDNLLHYLDELAKRHGTEAEVSRAKLLRSQADKLYLEKSEDRLRIKFSEIKEAYGAILHRQEYFWTEYFEELAQGHSRGTPSPAIDELVRQGRELIKANNLEPLKKIVYQLQETLPKKVVEHALRGFGSGLLA